MMIRVLIYLGFYTLSFLAKFFLSDVPDHSLVVYLHSKHFSGSLSSTVYFRDRHVAEGEHWHAS